MQGLLVTFFSFNCHNKIVINIAPNASVFTMTYTKILSGSGSAPDPIGLAYSAAIAFMAGIKLLQEFQL